MSVVQKDVGMVKVCDDCYQEYKPQKSPSPQNLLKPTGTAGYSNHLGPNPRSHLKKIRSETSLVGAGGAADKVCLPIEK